MKRLMALLLVCFVLGADAMAQTILAASTPAFGVTSGTINSTGATAVIMYCDTNSGASTLVNSPAPDSKGNYWTAATPVNANGSTGGGATVWGRVYVTTSAPLTGTGHYATCPSGSTDAQIIALSGTSSTGAASVIGATNAFGAFTSAVSGFALAFYNGSDYSGGTMGAAPGGWTAISSVYHDTTNNEYVAGAYNASASFSAGASPPVYGGTYVYDMGAIVFASSSSPAATPTFSPVAGTYSSAQTVTLSDTTTGAVIHFTVDGSTPTCSSATYSSALAVSSTETVNAIACATGYTSSAVGSAVYTITSPTAATPTFSPVAGTYSSAQTVTLSDTTTGAVIHYTVDGSTPTCSSATYSSALAVSSTETVNAIACATGYTSSGVGSALYTISLTTTATPTFTPGAGTFTSAQTVAVSDSTTGAVIHYTVDGSTPTCSSATYSTPLTVSSTETVNAVGCATGYANSAIGSALYTITTGAGASYLIE